MAQHLKVPPVRIGFHVASIAIIELLRFAPLEPAATLPKRLSLLYEQARIFILPPRRTRSRPRVVKHKASKHQRKMPVSA
ncbi:hypothetical protein [Variovorax fucosicus]|uniref:hypothetical protein n=1 Tax=Variovorax fucosicus TaxID=3053517 RepID=UPI002577D062|nr:hypothetical protein [Variovorax sp. J22G47]MDM0054925.1 hypothetical protein [Variovorax sp. J22G47]